MSKKISGSEFPLSKIFSSEFDYVIPAYQRPFAWTIDQASDLFSDLFNFHQSNIEDNYFLGSIVLIKEDNHPRSEVIDGQQRLTTLTILFSAIAANLDENLLPQFKKYFLEPGDSFQNLSQKPRLTIRERDQNFFSKYIQGMEHKELVEIDQARLENESQKNIQSIFKYFHENITKNFSSQETLRNFASFLVNSCFLVAVTTPNQDSAFRVFSVLNNRGLDLQPTDIIKAEVIGSASSDMQEELTDQWENLEDLTGRAGFNDLFGHIRMIFLKSKPIHPLLDDFKECVIRKYPNSVELMKKIIKPYADGYVTVKYQQYVSTNNPQEVNRLLKWLNKIDNSDWIPVAILFLAKVQNDNEYTLWFFNKLERLAAFLHICEKDVNKRIKRYACILLALEEDPEKINLIDKIDLTVEEKNEMVRNLDGSIYEKTARRRNYLIQRLDSFISDGGAIYENKLLTIEHVLAQTIREGSDWLNFWPYDELRNNWLHRLANLVPLNKERNSLAQNYPFPEKKEKYFSGTKNVSSYSLTSQVLAIDEWTPKIVEHRQKELLKILIDRWELF